MKRYTLIFAALFAFCATFAQSVGNIQAQYDFGHKFATITAEINHFDKIGSGFGFVDLDCDPITGQSGLYLEYGYTFHLYKGLGAHIEYNGGVLFDNGITYAHGALCGVSYQIPYKTHFFQVMAQYRMDIDYSISQLSHGIQATGVWSCLWLNHIYFGGYVDLNFYLTNGFRFGISSEPQLLYQFNNHALGVEVEIENYTGVFHAHPKVMYKYIF